MTATRPTEISVLAELERYQLKHVWAGDDEVKVLCPFHDDSSPSCCVSLSKRVFNCKAGQCLKAGDIVTLLAGKVKQPRAVVLEELGARYDLDDVKVVDPATVERWHSKIWQAGPLLKALRDRGVSDDVIRARKLGEDSGRVTIPVGNDRGDWVNVRKYLPGAAGADKMKNMRGRGQGRWYPQDQLRFGTVLLVGGEMKALVAAEQLNRHGVGAVSYTSEKRVPAPLLKDLAGKSVYVCMDVDAAGRKAALDNLVALRPIAAESFDLLLPLDLAAHPKGDVNDFVAGGGDLWGLMAGCERWVAPEPGLGDLGEPESVHLSVASNARYAGRRVRVLGSVMAMDTAPYSVPREVEVLCDRNQNFCAVCPVWRQDGGTFAVPAESPAVLEAVGGDQLRLHQALVGAVGVPRQCRVCSFKTLAYWNAEDVRLQPALEITSRASDQRVQPAVCVGPGLEVNQPYELVGRVLPHPKTQQSTLLISEYKPTTDALSTHEPGAEELGRLAAFRPAEWTQAAVAEKLSDVYRDLERCVTRIRQREDMHLAMDLAWHSPLLITYDGRVQKGWTEVLVAGDSAQGKSEAADGLRRHYGLGGKMECKNATAAGVMGGLQQLGSGRWFVTWGFLPMHDRQLAHLEELKGMRPEEFGKLTDARSSGVAELTKIEKRRTHMRTRLLATSNPRVDGRVVASYSYGIEMLRELVGALEDLRRFDLCYVVDRRDVDADAINRPWPSNGHPAYPSDLCRSLVLWAWTRTAAQVAVGGEARELCAARATELCAEYTDAIPVVDPGSMRYKLARLSAALACRTFSSTEDGLGVVVRPCHVEHVVALLRRVYSSRAFGYREFTDAVRSTTALVDEAEVRGAIASLPFPHDFAESLLRCERLELQDLMDWCGYDRVQGSQLLSRLVRKHALRRDARSYRKTPAFIELLRRVLADRTLPDRPDHIPETEF